ncbi:MAG: fatty acid desaturase [Deltaproteobacteria bacterium]|nr:fatty acid desaturase [Deltaproteobacteria bacterium]
MAVAESSRQVPDHHELVGRLSREQRLDLLQRSDVKGLLHLSGHLGALGVTGSLIAFEAPGWPVLLPLHGILLVFLFCLQHEAVHKTPFRSAGLNAAAAWGAGVVRLLPPVWFQHFHMDHHRYTHDPVRDPELARPLPRSKAGLAWHLAGGPYWTGQLRTLAVNAAGLNRDAFVPPPARAQVAREARWFLAIYVVAAGVSILFGNAVLLWLWLLPVLLGEPFLRIYLLAEHTGCPHVPNMLDNTRTTLTTMPVRFIAWNMPFHVEHHAYPAVPFHRLPAFHDVLRDHLTVTANGYTAATRAATAAALRGGA